MEKITKRTMYAALVNFAQGKGFEVETEDGVVEIEMDQLETFALNEITLLDNKAAKAKERAAKKKAEADELMKLVEAELGEELEPIAEIAARVAEKDAEATVSKVTYRLTQLTKAGVAKKEQIKIEGSEGQKARNVMGYALA